MLDSSSFKIPSNNKFEPKEYLYQTCEECKVSVTACIVDYKKGWAGLIYKLVIQLKSYPVEIRGIDDYHGQLQVKFIMLKQRNEVKVWRLLDELRLQSCYTCMECGSTSNTNKSTGIKLNLCSDCEKSAAKLGYTGTWLDKY